MHGVLLVGGLIAAVQAAAPSPPAAQDRSAYHVVFLKLGPKWARDLPATQQAGIPEHGQYMSSLSSAGTLILGGPFIEDARLTATGAMVIFNTADAGEARRLMEADPGVKSGLFEVGEVRRLLMATGSWRPWKRTPAP